MSDTPPHASNGRDRTPDLTSKREKRPRDAEEDDRDRHGSSRRRHREDYANDEEYERDRERRHRQREREREEDPDREERRRRRHHDDETEEEREERRRRRRERERERELRERDDPNYERDRYREREPRSERDSGAYRGRELIDDTPRSAGWERSEVLHGTPDRSRRDSRPRDRSRDSYRSHRSRDVRDDGTAPSVRELTREEKEAERERREREMADERRERARQRDAHFERMDRERRDDRRRSPPPRDYSPPRRHRGSPPYDDRGPRDQPPPPPPPPLDPAEALIQSFESENRSIFISQIATRLTSQDLGLFFEDKLGRGAVRDARVVTDRGSKRSKGIGYVELDDVSLVNKALSLSGTIVMGIPIIVQLTEAEKNHEGKTAAQLAAEATRFLSGPGRGPREHREPAIQFPPLSTGLRLPPNFDPQAHQEASVPYYRLFVTGLAYTLNEQDIAAVFEPFGQVEFIDLHKDYAGSSKGTAYVQYQNLRGAQMALDAMNGFELAGRPIRVQTIQERSQISEHLEDSGYGPRMDAKQRQSLMQKLARTEPEQKPGQASASRAAPARQQDADIRPTPFLVAGNMFNPEEETERNWDLDLAEDVKAEVERQYGTVKRIKVDKLSAGEVYMEFPDAETAARAQRGLSGRFFGGRQLSASFISEALFKAHM